MVACSAFEGTFSLLVRNRLGLTLSATGAVFRVIGIALVLVQTLLRRSAAARLGEIGTVRMGLAANAAGLVLLAADGGWDTLVPALAMLVVGQGPSWGRRPWSRWRSASSRRPLVRVGSLRIDALAWLPPGNMRSTALRTTRGSDA
jgi:hypothetical protein